MRSPLLAAITLHPSGGGIAGITRLIWQALQARWSESARLVTLVTAESPASLHSSIAARLAFGARVGALQAAGLCDWVFYSHLGLAKVQRVAPRGRRRPYVVYLHGIEAWRPLGPSDIRLLSNAALRFANSAYTAGRVREQHPGIGPITVCPPAVPPPWRSDGTPARQGAPGIGPRAVVIVARLSSAERYKGHDALLEAWPLVAARQADAQLVVVGDGDDLPRLRAKARDLGVAGRVLFTGYVNDAGLAAIYAQSAVFAMPSRGEGFGLAYLEAMSHGVPCVGAVHDAANEVIEDGVTGFLVDQADTAGLADRLVLLLGDETRRRAMGEAGRRRVAAEFTADRFGARLLARLDDALEAVSGEPAAVASRSL